MNIAVASDDKVIRELLLAVAAGDARAFGSLHRRTRAKMLKTATDILRNRYDAEDAVQDGYLKIWKYAGRYEPYEAFSAISWMARIVRNASIDSYRARRPQSDELPADLADNMPNPEEQTYNGQRRRYMDGLLSRLDDKKRGVVLGAYVDGDSYRALSEQFDLPLNTVRTRLRRGLADLRVLALTPAETGRAVRPPISLTCAVSLGLSVRGVI